jgi:hypothetical protein
MQAEWWVITFWILENIVFTNCASKMVYHHLLPVTDHSTYQSNSRPPICTHQVQPFWIVGQLGLSWEKTSPNERTSIPKNSQCQFLYVTSTDVNGLDYVNVIPICHCLSISHIDSGLHSCLCIHYYMIPESSEFINSYQPIIAHIFTHIKEDLSPLDVIVVVLIISVCTAMDILVYK